MKRLIGVFDVKKMSPEQIYEKVKESLSNQRAEKKNKVKVKIPLR